MSEHQSVPPQTWQLRLFQTSERCELSLREGECISIRRAGDPHELVLNDPTITRGSEHVVRLRAVDGKILVDPTGASQTILINGVKLKEPQPIQVGDRLRIGYTTLVFQSIADGSASLATSPIRTAFVIQRDEIGREVNRLALWSEGVDELRTAATEVEAAAVFLRQIVRLMQVDRVLVAQTTHQGEDWTCRELATSGLSAGEVEQILRWFSQARIPTGAATPAAREIHGGDARHVVAVGRVDDRDMSWLIYGQPSHGPATRNFAHQCVTVLAHLVELYRVLHQRESSDQYIADLRRTVTAYTQPLERAALETVESKFLFRSSAMRSVCRALARAAAATSPVLLMGEPGTGKQVAAEALHAASQRRHREMVSVSIAEYPESLVEGALFGQVKGAFTGATARQGLIAHADGSTLFLDEIGEVSPNIQTKLLRVLERGELRRLGEVQVTKVNLRLITATNRHLPEEVAHGRFRQDFYDRISVIPIVLPPLRDRADDIPLLATHFLQHFNNQMAKQVRISDEGLRHLGRYTWPDNVRGLRNYIERMVAMADLQPEALGPDQMPPFHPVLESVSVPRPGEDLIRRLRDLGRAKQARILAAFCQSAERLTKNEWSERLGISRPVLRSELKHLIAFSMQNGVSSDFFEQRVSLRREDWEFIKQSRVSDEPGS